LLGDYSVSAWRRPACWGLAFGLTMFLAFPHAWGEGALDLGWVFGWAPPACLVLALRGTGSRRGAAIAFLLGWAAYSAIFHWIYVVTVRYGHAPAAVGVLASVGLALYPAVFFAAFGALWGRRTDPETTPIWAGAALWTALEHARSFVATGFPWALLGYAHHENGALLGWAAWTGVYGLSFWAALGGVAIAAAWCGERRRAALALAVVLAAHGAGWLLAQRTDPDAGPTLRVAVAQGNIDQGEKWSPDAAERTLAIYSELTRRAAAAGAALVVWPETAVPGSPDLSPELRSRLAELATETGTILVAGAVGWEGEGERARVYDSAFVWNAEGHALGRYDKSHLVPFGEYVPLRSWLGGWVGAVARGIAPLDVTAGRAPRPLTFGETMTGGIPICYELLFPDLVRRFVGDGAEILLAMTNDAWYGRTGAPHQFMAITALRSAETRVWTARAANTGVSGFIDARGRVRAATRIFERDVVVADVPLRPAPAGGSFYTRHGDWFAWATGIVAGWSFGIAPALRHRASSRNGGSP